MIIPSICERAYLLASQRFVTTAALFNCTKSKLEKVRIKSSWQKHAPQAQEPGLAISQFFQPLIVADQLELSVSEAPSQPCGFLCLTIHSPAFPHTSFMPLANSRIKAYLR
jgi:hypothetical protein